MFLIIRHDSKSYCWKSQAIILDLSQHIDRRDSCTFQSTTPFCACYAFFHTFLHHQWYKRRGLYVTTRHEAGLLFPISQATIPTFGLGYSSTALQMLSCNLWGEGTLHQAILLSTDQPTASLMRYTLTSKYIGNKQQTFKRHRQAITMTKGLKGNNLSLM